MGMVAVVASTKLSKSQKEALSSFLEAVGQNEAEFIRAAIGEKIEREGGCWPDDPPLSHGGKRRGAGRKRNPQQLGG